MMPSIVALIPARAGSRRIKHKNVRELGGKPLLQWTINGAKESGLFGDILLCTDSQEYGELGKSFGATFCRRPSSADDEADIVWVKQALRLVHYDAFAILRPTSPFRTPDTIRRAWQHFLDNQPCDSLRAVEPVRQHPGKMWVIRQSRLLPLLPWENEASPWHSSATQTLPPVYVQNASLEIAWVKTVLKQGTIAGTNVLPFMTEGMEGFDINDLEDWERAERLAAARHPLAVGQSNYGECD